jgi:hypothetical protein
MVIVVVRTHIYKHTVILNATLGTPSAKENVITKSTNQ